MNHKSSSNKSDTITAAILVIGDEILSGRTKDANINYIARHLTKVGITLMEVRVIGDHEETIISALNELRQQYDYLFTTGGIGPTHDDITAPSVAKAFSTPLILDERAIDMMKQRYTDQDLTDARLRMARIPEGAELIENSISFAPGFMIENVIVLAGVPAIMQVMLDAVTSKLRVGMKIYSINIDLDHPESIIAKDLEELQREYSDVSMGSYPFFNNGILGTQLVLRSTNITELKSAEAKILACLNTLGLKIKPL